MSLENDLRSRAEDKCELCGATENLGVIAVGPDGGENVDKSILACSTCSSQIEDGAELNQNHWRCLNDSAWSTEPAVQVSAWRLLNRLSGEAWARDLLDTLYLDEETLAWAQAGLAAADDTDVIIHKDTNGTVLSGGDTVTLIKDLKVKGAGFTAKRGTAVRNISLVDDNAEHIEGRVNDQRIVILTEFVKKS
ncbi:alkylphosphonate utilization protein [Pseudovibrio sp. Tun.PSC04-5.I4]|uniref:PhnA domain-containing protein n=1 Tax=Pseudovibrio sp. Tun.PSC04-5.I4 TaxID=1798213 RepID=UPI00088A1F4D|nr:alkylphosphonate utilization protein [Pseudovibrio sp. Tun.PSC04-5.I4]SDR19049.1 phosphonoacetate hydrolase [Pseudovibrio sp. Tun.PSC04-5.I4]